MSKAILTNIWPGLASNHFDLILKVASNHKTVKLRWLRFANFVKSHYTAEFAVTWRPDRFLCRVFVEFWSNIVQLIWKKKKQIWWIINLPTFPEQEIPMTWKSRTFLRKYILFWLFVFNNLFYMKMMTLIISFCGHICGGLWMIHSTSLCVCKISFFKVCKWGKCLVRILHLTTYRLVFGLMWKEKGNISAIFNFFLNVWI